MIVHPIKICHITRDIEPIYNFWFGGVPNWIKTVCTELNNRNYQNIFITASTRNLKNGTKTKIYLSDCFSKYRKFQFLNRIISFFYILRVLKREKVDLIHLYHLGTLTELEIFLIKKIFRIPIIATLFSEVNYNRSLNLQYKILRGTFLDKIIPINRNLKNQLLKLRIQCYKLKQIPVTPKKEFYELHRNMSLESNQKVFNRDIKILFSSRLDKDMGLYYIMKEFIRLIKEIKNIKIIIAYYESPSKNLIYKKLQEHLKKQKLEDRFIFLDYIENIPKFLSQIDMYLIPILKYKNKMNTPKMIIEAMLQKVVVIATPYGGVPEIINSYENGILTEPKKNNFVEKIKEVLANPELRKKLMENGYNTAIKKFKIENIINQLENTYKNLIKISQR